MQCGHLCVTAGFNVAKESDSKPALRQESYDCETDF
jgi:hypothetical protein